MVLLAGAALFVRGLHEWNNRRFGWESDHLVTGTMLLPRHRPTRATRRSPTSSAWPWSVSKRCPASRPPASPYSMPFFGLAEPRKYLVAGRETPAARPGARRRHQRRQSPLFRNRRHPRARAGAPSTKATPSTSPKVFIINQAMARGLFGDESPLGRRIAQAGGETIEWGEIVGVVADIQSVVLGSDDGGLPALPAHGPGAPALQRDRRAHRPASRRPRSSTASAPP